MLLTPDLTLSWYYLLGVFGLGYLCHLLMTVWRNSRDGAFSDLVRIGNGSLFTCRTVPWQIIKTPDGRLWIDRDTTVYRTGFWGYAGTASVMLVPRTDGKFHGLRCPGYDPSDLSSEEIVDELTHVEITRLTL